MDILRVWDINIQVRCDKMGVRYKEWELYQYKSFVLVLKRFDFPRTCHVDKAAGDQAAKFGVPIFLGSE